MYQNLKFFNKKGEYCNFDYDSTNDKWSGRIDMHTISEGLIENQQLYILEEVADSVSGYMQYVFPHTNYISDPQPIRDKGVSVEFDSKNPVPEIFVYDLSDTEFIHLSQKVLGNLDYDPSQVVLPNNMKSTSILNSKSLQINIAFQPSREDSFSSILYIKDEKDVVFAEIKIYGEGESEDERLKSLLMSLGNDILPTDSIIFDTSDVNEENTDWRLINRKRKELLLEYHNIFPYVGSYKAIINILKFYGYQNVRLKEYWKNVDATSANYGKYRQTDITDIFSTTPDPQISSLLPSKIYRKTGKFGLFYDITVESGEYDDDGLPMVEEVYTFTPEEILTKIFALKKKLMQYFLPINTQIVDITGEAIFFAQYKINNLISRNRIDSLSIGLHPTYEVYPSETGYLEDLRALQFLGAPVGPDIGADGYSDYLIWRIYIDSNIITPGNDIVTTEIQYVDPILPYTYIGSVDTYFNDNRRSKNDYTIEEICERITDSINNPILDPIYNSQTDLDYIKSSIYAYPELDNPGWIRVVSKNPFIGATALTVPTINLVINIYGAPTTYPSNQSSTAIILNSGGFYGSTGSPISLYKSAYVGYFNDINSPVSNLSDAPNIPIGYPVLLKNTTFDITWENANVTFNQIDSIGSTFSTLYSNYTNSYDIIGWTGSTGIINPISIGVTGFPSVYPHQFTYSWENIGYMGYYEMQWKVTKSADETPAFSFDSGPYTIYEINEIGVNLPYVGKYDVQLTLRDLYNNRAHTSNKQQIEVLSKESDFIGWYSKRELDYTIDGDRKPVQTDITTNSSTFVNRYTNLINKDITWDEYASTWDLPLQPNEAIQMAELTTNSLDSIEFYQTMTNPIDNPLVDRYPYRFNLIDTVATWDDAYHLWWDNTGTRITEWKITNCTPIGQTSGTIWITRANSTLNLSNSLYYEVGPTGWTGPTSNAIPGSTGNIVYVKSLDSAFVHNGTLWELVSDELEAIKIDIPSGGTDKDNTLLVVNALNDYAPNSNIFKDFIYYYNEEYDSTYTLVSYIKAVSIDFDKYGRHRMNYENLVGENNSYDTTYFGYLGDIPTHFEIYDIPSGSTGATFSVQYNEGSQSSYEYIIGSTSLKDLCKELNGSTAQNLPVIGDFVYNMVYGSPGWTGGTGPSSFTEVKVQGVAKRFTDPQSITMSFGTDVKGTWFGRSLIKNPSWNDIRLLKYQQELPLLTSVNFTYDPSKIAGKTNFTWLLQNDDDVLFDDIYYNNPYFSYMFTLKGSYSLSLTIEDSNGNKKTIKKQEIIKIV
jgi:hypothetical protein